MTILLGIYIGTAIFGIGVTIIDLIGVLGQSSSESDTDIEIDMDTDTDTDLEIDSDSDFDSDNDFDGDMEMDSDDIGEDVDEIDDSSDSAEYGDKGSIIALDNKKKKINPLLKILIFLRIIIYFSIGFGPTGLFALLMKIDKFWTLAWSIPVGFMTLIIIFLLKRIQRTRLDSQLNKEDLFMAEAEVIVSINKGKLGKVRIKVADAYTDRFAKAEKNDKSFKIGDKVRVVKITDDCVYVEDEKYI